MHSKNLFCRLCLLFVLFGAQAQKTNKQPNVIIIYTDDQGSIDTNSYGATDLYTPNMDRLAKTGVKFTQFYAAACVCSPSRASLLTGKTPLAAGLPGNAPSKKGIKGMPTDQLTLAEKLKENGYATAHIGKWHLGYTTETRPNAQGFDYSFGHMGGCIDNYSHFFYWAGPNGHDLWENEKEVWMDGQYFQDLMSAKALQFIDTHKEKPFFMYYAMNLPHYPLQGTDKWRKYYKDMESPRDKYAAAVSTVDEYIGVVLEKLNALNIRDNTLLIFQSDHGHSLEERTFKGGGSAGPYRGSKFSFFEGGIRVPAIISYPKTIPQDKTTEALAVNVDWFPTVLDFLNIEYKKSDFAGKSLKKVLLKNADSPHKSFWWWENEQRWAVRKGDWKLLKNPKDPAQKKPVKTESGYFLVNLKEDIAEQKNLAKQYPKKVQELEALHEEWYDRNR